MPEPDNIFEAIPRDLPGELVEVLARGSGPLRIERIVSRGHTSPESFWYDQRETEWVVVLKGSAVLRFEDDSRRVALRPGDWIEIPARRRHRVEESCAEGETVWLAVFWEEPGAPAPSARP